MTEKQTPYVLQVGPSVRGEVGEFVGRNSVKAGGLMLVLVVVSIIMIVRSGFSPRSILCLIGPVLSIAGLIGFNGVVIDRAVDGASKRGWIPWFSSMGVFLPYAFACYLFFYEGLWQAAMQFKTFSIASLVGALFCVIAGYVLVNACYRVSVFASALSDGRIIIKRQGDNGLGESDSLGQGHVAHPIQAEDTHEPSSPYAGFWIRVGAYCIDVVVMLIPLNLLRFLMKAGTSPDTYDQTGTELIVSVAWWIYCAVLESSPWQGTVGKKVLGLIVTDLNHKRIGFGRATGRFFAELLSFLLLAVGVMMVGWTQKKQGLHDMIAGTLVLKKRN